MSERNDEPLRVMVAHSTPDDFREMLEGRFPGVAFSYAASPEAVAPTLERARPRVVFSVKQPKFPGPAHRPIIEYPGVEWVQVGGSGYEHLVPWDQERLTLTHCAGVLARFLAETVTGAMLMLNNGLLRYRELQRARTWEQHYFTPLAGRTLLIVGVGAIGGHFADNAKALGMKVLGVRGRSEVGHPSVEEMHPPGALETLLGRADVVSLHVRLSETTTHLMNRRTIALMKPGAMLLNTARGPVVEEAALLEALRSGQLSAAYLDVFETEPLPADNPLWSVENLFMTPHVADSVHDWPRRYAEFFAGNLARWREGEPLENVAS